MAVVKLGARPKTFRRPIKFPMLEGGEGTIEVVYKYRTRKEYGVFLDQMVEAGKLKAAQIENAEEAAVFSMERMLTGQDEANADYILEVIEGWNIADTEFNAANVLQLCEELPAAALAIIETYRIACTQGRLGN